MNWIKTEVKQSLIVKWIKTEVKQSLIVKWIKTEVKQSLIVKCNSKTESDRVKGLCLQ